MKPNPHRDLLNSLHTPDDLAAYLQTERAKLLALLANGQCAGFVALLADSPKTRGLGLPICYAFSDLTDAVLARLFQLACLHASVEPSTLPLTLIATGGYGRRELCPFSDIDLAFVPQRDSDPRIDRVVRTMFTQIMAICVDKAGLKVGYAYRLVEDCAALDHQTTTGLLDARLIAGNERLFIQFENAFWEGFNPADFIFTKLAERRRVLARWGTLPHVVEPQLKEGPGGLRDVQTAVWLVQARENLAAARVRGARGLEALQREGYLRKEEAERLSEAKDHLLAVRNVLQARSGAARDLLVRTRQEEIAERLGYDRLPGMTPQTARQETSIPPVTRQRGEAEDIQAQRDTLPVERFMAALYPDMASVRRNAARILEQVENSRLLLGVGLDCLQRHIVPANGALETESPLWLLWVCELAQKYGLELGADLTASCETLLAMWPRLDDTRGAAAIFTRLLARRGQVAKIMQIMADVGILGWFLPEFGRVLNLIPYDPAHDYTVGQHTLNVLCYLDQLASEEENEAQGGRDALPPDGALSGEQWKEMRRVMKALGDPEQLMLAALLHDCGKRLRGGSGAHAEVGAEIARGVCKRLQWDTRAAEDVVFLVRHHLLMAETSRLRDLTLDETIQEFAHIVGNTDRLDKLYLLTYADTRAVGEGVWTHLNGQFLQELWQRTGAELSRKTVPSASATPHEARLERARRRLLNELKLENLPEAEVTEHVEAMPPHYLLNQGLEQIALHIGLVRRVRQGEIMVDFHNSEAAAYTELTVCTRDDPTPGLLAKIAGVLYASELTAHSAQVFTRVTGRDWIALDIVRVDFRGRPLSSGKQQEVNSRLHAVLRGELTLEVLLQQQRTTTPGRITVKAAGGETAADASWGRANEAEPLMRIEIEDPEIKAALFRTSQAMARLGWDIRSARVSMFHGVARATFYVSGASSYSEAEIKSLLSDCNFILQPEGIE